MVNPRRRPIMNQYRGTALGNRKVAHKSSLNTPHRPLSPLNLLVFFIKANQVSTIYLQKMTPKGQIPTVDISAFTTGNDSSARQATAKSLAQACLNGCVGIIGHGVPAELLKQGFDIAKQLFDLPMSDKMKAPHPKGAIPHRGYSAPGMEKAYSKEDLETNDDAHRDSLRKVTDCKVSRRNQVATKSFSLTRCI